MTGPSSAQDANAGNTANPLLVPPPGGWIDPSNEPIPTRAALLVGPVTAFYILALGAIGLRVWSRHIKKISWRLSDYAVLIAALFGTGYLAICWLGETPLARADLLLLFILAMN